MRNKLVWIGTLVLIITLLVGCSNDNLEESDDVDVNAPDNEKKADDTEEVNDDTVVDAPYSFTEIEVDVDMDGVNDALEVEYEVESHKVDASYKNKSEDVYLKDEEAMEHLEPILDSFTFDENSSEDEILEQILESFSIDAYDEIEIEITFKDNTKIEIER